MKEFTINLPQDQETDVILVLPNGEKIALQYRLEMPSIDVCLPENLYVTNWKGDDMEPAPTLDDNPERTHERFAKQLCIGLRPTHVDVELEAKAEAAGIPMFPNLTPDRANEMEKQAERKQHLEYLCYMMLRRLNEATDLKSSLKHGMKSYGFAREEQNELLKEFFGDLDKDEEAGCCEAEGHTIPSLLEEWQNTTEAMMRCLTP